MKKEFYTMVCTCNVKKIIKVKGYIIKTLNNTFGIYKNELQIVLKPHMESRKNKVGEISEDELFLLDFIKPWTKFRLSAK